jgi:hypothetical protein
MVVDFHGRDATVNETAACRIRSQPYLSRLDQAEGEGFEPSIRQ